MMREQHPRRITTKWMTLVVVIAAAAALMDTQKRPQSLRKDATHRPQVRNVYG
jgi:hypothetical protein